MGFPGQDSWSGFLFPSQGDLPVPGIEPGFPHLHADSLLTELPGKPNQIQSECEVQFSSEVTQSCLTLCDPMNHSTPGLPVHHQLPEFTQTLVHRVSDAIQPSHPLSSPSPALNLSQHWGLFQRVGSSHQFSSVAQSCPTLCDPMNCSTPGFPIHRQARA